MNNKLDIEAMAEELEFDVDEVEMLIEVFLKNAYKHIEKLRNYADNKDLDGLYHSAHSLKGGASNILLDSISNLAAEIEVDALNKHDVNYYEKIDKLKVMVDSLHIS